MGGIAAIVDFGQRPDPGLGRLLSRSVALRGPDQEGIFEEGPIFLAQRRKVVTPEGWRQPLVSERFALAFDGRLYDHVDLARVVPGGTRNGERSPPDAAVLLRAWEARGPACLERLDGTWAIAVWDRQEQVLWLARDPLGVRPLFYSAAGGRLSVASLADRLCALPWISRELCPDNLREYLAFRYVHAPRTLLRDVCALPPGCVLRFDRGGTRVRAHTRLSYGSSNASAPSTDQGVREVDRLLRRAVARRGRAGVPVGVLLSGGIDSTNLALNAVRCRLDVRGYHVHFPESGVDEAAFARRVARLLEIPYQQVELDAAGFAEALERCTAVMGCPLPDPGAVAQYTLLRQARRDVGVVLSGDGGDELFAGGHLAGLSLLMKQANLLGRATGPLRRRIGGSLATAGLADLALHPMRYGLQRLVGGTEVFDHAAREEVLQVGRPRPQLRREVLLPLYTGIEADPINTLLAVFQRGWLPEDILARSDRLAAGCGIEQRYPMLDQGLLTYVNGIPGGWKLRARWGLPRFKWPLRRLLRGHVPRSVYDRPKRSWPTPLNRWLRHEGTDFLRDRADRLLDAPWGLWKPDPVRAMVRAHLEGERYHGGALWLLILLESWLRQLHAPR